MLCEFSKTYKHGEDLTPAPIFSFKICQYEISCYFKIGISKPVTPKILLLKN